jgi:hypothetical protein
MSPTVLQRRATLRTQKVSIFYFSLPDVAACITRPLGPSYAS